MRERILIFILLSLVGLSFADGVKSSDLPKLQKRTIPTDSYTQLKVVGPISVSLRAGYARPQVTLSGDAQDLRYVQVTVRNNVLLVSLDRSFSPLIPIRAEIHANQLRSLIYRGKGKIDGSGLNTRFLDVDITNNGNTTLKGQLGLHRLVLKGDGYTRITGIQSSELSIQLSGKSRTQLIGVADVTSMDILGDAWLSLYWLKSKTLRLHAKGHSFIQLGGLANRLEAEICESACFNGRYLRAKVLFVKTFDNAVAEVLAVKRQHTLATGSSNIYFYNIPELKTDFMAYNGAVLDMRDWNDPFIQEYTVYNK